MVRSDKAWTIYLVTADGTSSGYYEHAASACVFPTYDEAKAFVENALRHNVEVCGLTEDEARNACSWEGENCARFRWGPDVVSEYEIEKLKMPVNNGEEP